MATKALTRRCLRTSAFRCLRALSDFSIGHMSVTDDPLETFSAWMDKARQQLPDSAETAAFATSDGSSLRPSVRPLRLACLEDGSLLFLSNSGSQKIQDLQSNPQVAVYFWWPSLGRCVRIEGRCDLVAEKERVLSIYRRMPEIVQRGFMACGDTQGMAGVSSDGARSRMKEVTTLPAAELTPPSTLRLLSIVPDYFEFYETDPSIIADRTVFRRDKEKIQWHRNCLSP